MACCFNQQGIAGKELTGMATLAAIGDIHMLYRKKCGRGKISSRIMAHRAIVQRRNMIGFFVYCPYRDVIGIAIVTALAIAGDTRVNEV